jgi:hypothetical protein
MSVQIVSLNYSAHVWSPASWGDLDGFQGLLGVGAPSRTPKPDFSPARAVHTHARTHTSGRPRWPAQNETAAGTRPEARAPRQGLPPVRKIIIRTNAFVESCLSRSCMCYRVNEQLGGNFFDWR